MSLGDIKRAVDRSDSRQAKPNYFVGNGEAPKREDAKHASSPKSDSTYSEHQDYHALIQKNH